MHRWTFRTAPVAALTLMMALATVGCTEDGPIAGDVEKDVAADIGADLGADVTPDVPADTGPEVITVVNPHSCREIGDVTFIPGDIVACEFGCFDENGKSKKTLCPEPFSEWNCVTGCCLPVFKCETDADCLGYGYTEGSCDERYDCRCDTANNTCENWYCSGDSDCCGDETCSAGACGLLPDVSTLQIRIVAGVTVLTPGASTELKVEAFDPAWPDIVIDAGTVTWSSADDAAIAVDGGTVTGGTTAGEVVITATATGGANDTITLANVVPDGGATFTAVTAVEGTVTPVAGRYALVDHDTQTVVETNAIGGDGIISTTATVPAGGFDVHVFGDNSEWISVLAVTEAVIYLPIRRQTFGEIELDNTATLVPEGTDLIGTNILRGAPDYSIYPTQGEFEVSLNSFALSSGLLDFNLDAILGSNVKRYFDPDFPLAGLIDITQQSEIPGGLTFGLEGPAIPDFVLAAPAGKQTLWTLGGRAPAAEVTPYISDIIGAVSGDSLDLGRVVTAIIPLFDGFYSAVTPGLEFSGDGSTTVTDAAPKLRVPLTLATEIMIPDLPEVETGVWAEVVFMLAGAMRNDGSFVPLGLNAGADTNDAESNAPDGTADSDPKTPAADPYVLKYAPMHSGLSETSSQFASALVALSIDPGGNSTRKDGGSALINRADVGSALAAQLPVQEFLPFATGSAFDAATRALTVVAPTGADTTRVLFKSGQGANWTVWLNGTASYTVPVPADLLGVPVDDRADGISQLLINSFDFTATMSLAALLSPGTLTLDRLLLAVDRVSFLDVRP